jgi:hypothetical protein
VLMKCYPLKIVDTFIHAQMQRCHGIKGAFSIFFYANNVTPTSQKHNQPIFKS